MKTGGVTIIGGANITGDVVGGNKIGGRGGEVACDFVWRGAVLSAICFPEDQRRLQSLIDRYLDNDISYDELVSRVKILSGNLAAQIERLEKDRK